MRDWKDQATEISDDVVFFEFVSSDLAKDAPEVFVWDLDKTYLDTHFESLTGLYRTIIEKAFQKKNVPGTSSLVRALTSKGASDFPIYFVTASPPQMAGRIRDKLEFDGIKPYGIFFKDNLRNLRPGRFRRLNKQVGFKVQALMQLRTKLHENLHQILWGDDSESDAVIYSLYSDICSRRLQENSLRQILSHFHVRGEQTDLILDLQSKVPEQDPVEKIYINLATDTDPEYYYKFGRRTIPSFNTFQITLDLYQDKHLNESQLIMVCQDLIENYAFSPEELAYSMDDLVRRKILIDESVDRITLILKNEGLLPAYYNVRAKPIGIEELQKRRDPKNTQESEAWIPEFIDYLHDFR